MKSIPLSRAFVADEALATVAEAIAGGPLSGDGRFGRRCEALLEQMTGAPAALLTPSATAALELAAMTLGLGPGDEVVMPSFTFPSTANAVVLRGAVPVFCDVRADTLNADAEHIAACLTPRTRAVVVVHYAGMPAAMTPIVALCREAGVALVEDAAQALGASLEGTPAGRFGTLGALSFHETKNIGCGEGGALLVNDPALRARAEVHREKGTDRSRFVRGEVDRYAWQDLGSSWVTSELVAAYLAAQLPHTAAVNDARRGAWARYHAALAPLEAAGRLRRPGTTPGAMGNAHLYFVVLDSVATRDRVAAALRADGIEVARHYVPLHSAPAGRRLGRAPVPLPVTDDVPERLLRLPLWAGMPEAAQDRVVGRLQQLLRG